MAPTTIRRAALALPSDERAALAAELLASLDEGGDELGSDLEWDSAWGDELERRADEFDAGRVEAVSADEVFADARRRRAARQ
jgi:putative addiction module component (TIGR02574 family)